MRPGLVGAAMLCLVVEFQGMEGELLPFTRENPGATIEVMAQPPTEGDNENRPALLLVRGAPWQARHAPVTTLRRSPRDSLWFGRATFHNSAFDSPSGKAMLGLLHMLGPPWIHLEHGVVHLRARLKDPAYAEDAIHLAEEGLAAVGIEAQVSAQEISPKDHSVWESLVQMGIGIDP